MDSKVRDVHVERYYPSVLAPALEFKELAVAEDKEYHVIWSALWKWFLNGHVYHIDEDGAARWEKMLRIFPRTGSTLEERKQAILMRLNYQMPYTIRRLRQIYDAVYGEGMIEVDDQSKEYALLLTIDNEVVLQVNNLRTLTRSIIPANLLLQIIQEFPVELYMGVGGSASMVDIPSIDAANDFSIENIPLSQQGYGGIVTFIMDTPRIGTNYFTAIDDDVKMGLYTAGAVVATGNVEDIRTQYITFDGDLKAGVFGAGTVGGVVDDIGAANKQLQ